MAKWLVDHDYQQYGDTPNGAWEKVYAGTSGYGYITIALHPISHFAETRQGAIDVVVSTGPEPRRYFSLGAVRTIEQLDRITSALEGMDFDCHRQDVAQPLCSWPTTALEPQ